VSKGKIYVFGGYDGTSYLDSIERYCVATDRWEMLACVLNRPIQNTGAACFSNNQILIAGGYNQKGT
jgi:N-acetylneuraminic acid mutarotase